MEGFEFCDICVDNETRTDTMNRDLKQKHYRLHYMSANRYNNSTMVQHINNSYYILKRLWIYTQNQPVFISLILILITQSVFTSATVTYPPFTNLALEKPISLDPPIAVCGLNLTSVDYCKSSTTRNSVEFCRVETCIDYCPFTSELKSGDIIKPLTDTSYAPPDRFSSCVVKQSSTINPPAHITGEVTEFRATSQTTDCGLELNNILYINVLLGSLWNVTFTFHIYNRMEDDDVGTLFDIADGDGNPVLRIYIQNEALYVKSGDVTLTQDDWIVPSDQWVHVGVSVYEEDEDNFRSVTVYINGQVAGVADYGGHLRTRNDASDYFMGQDATGQGTFKGYLAEFRLLLRVLSNREVEEMYMDVLPELRIQSHCRCPSSYPLTSESDPTFCVRNPLTVDLGDNLPQLRIQDSAQPVEFVNDGQIDSRWISDAQREEVFVEIDLGQVFEIRHVTIRFYSPFPGVVIIERTTGSSTSFQHWQLFSDECVDKTGYQREAELTSADDVRCNQTVQPNTPLTYSNGVLLFDLTQGRSPWINSDGRLSNDLRGFLLADKLRFRLKGHPYTINNQHEYHALYEITINGTCNCNGRGVGCDMSADPYVCECADSSYSQGDQCETCMPDTYQLTAVDTDYLAPCLPCDCDPAGTVGAQTTCDPTTGQCPCKDNVEGLRCEVCASGYYGLNEDDQGCTQCDCDDRGVEDPSQPCNISTGVCICREHVLGSRCDSCEDGYFLSTGSDDRCVACACNADGTIGDLETCDLGTGQCTCKANVEGRACDDCAPGFYNLDVTNSDGCQACDCEFSGALNNSCDQMTGNCFCKPNVGGTSCSTCDLGFYALDNADFEANGCLYECNCSTDGSANQNCAERGGQCPCKANTQGRMCDECKDFSYDFGGSASFGCRACACATAGTISANATCDINSGQCYCKSRVQGRKCDTCVPGYFGLATAAIEGCSPCDCYALGTIENSTCDGVSGQCQCKPGEGDSTAGGKQCRAYVSETVPRFGPESGGTDVVMDGGFLGNVTQATVQFITTSIGELSCPINLQNSNASRIECTTQQVRNSTTDLKDEELSIELTLENNEVLTLGSYTYLEDPIINDIYPLRSIVSGGIKLTVTGEYLDSIAFPYLEVTMVYSRNGQEDSQVFDSLCNVENGEKMMCPTPEITLPSGFDRRKRDVQSFWENVISERESINSDRDTTYRQKRQTEPSEVNDINSDTLQFYIGFRLDGVTRYKNISDAMPEFGILSVYINPEFETFKDDVITYQPYWPFNDDRVDIKGSQLDYGAKEEDYLMRIGDERCKKIGLTSNRIICFPPDSQPKSTESASRNGAPPIIIEVGRIKHVAGYLKYEMTFWDNMAFRYGVIGGCCGVLLMIILIVICCICYRRRKNKSKDSADKKLSHLDQFDHHVAYPEDNQNTNKKKSVINAYDHNNFHFPTLNTEKKPVTTPRPSTQTLPPPNRMHQNHQIHNNGSASSYLNPTTNPRVLDVISPELKYRVQSALIHDQRLVLGRLILEGKIGNINFGRLDDRYNVSKSTVLVKRLIEPGMVPREINNFLEDTCVLRDVTHHNVHRMVGIMIEENTVMAVWPTADNGSIKSFITNDENMLTVGELIEFGQQVATGMMQLAERKVVHKDLACRNCVVTKDLVVKVADSALSRDKYPEDYWRGSGMKRSLPVRWMALESLEIDVFTTKGDVWSFGILLWELLTRGCLPYPEQKNSSIKSYLMCGNRMDRPDFAPEEIYALMLNCWDESPRERPTFPDVQERIGDFLEAQNTRTNLRNRGRQQVPSSRRRGHSNYAMIYQ